MSILDAHLSLFDSEHSPTCVAQLKNVAGQTLNRPVFVNAADHQAARFEHDGVICGVGNGPARSDRRQARAAASTQTLVYCIVMQIG
jgi:hypothetical protein